MSQGYILTWLRNQRLQIEETKKTAEHFSEKTATKIMTDLDLLINNILSRELITFALDDVCGIVTSYIPCGIEHGEIVYQFTNHSDNKISRNDSVVFQITTYLDIFSKKVLNSITLSFRIGFPEVKSKSGFYGVDNNIHDENAITDIVGMFFTVIEDRLDDMYMLSL